MANDGSQSSKQNKHNENKYTRDGMEGGEINGEEEEKDGEGKKIFIKRENGDGREK